MTQGRAISMNEFLAEWLKPGGIGFGVGALVAWIIKFRASRDDAKQARLDRGFAAYTAKLEERCAKLETRCDQYEREIEACHADKRELAERVGKLEGHSTGVGDIRQNEQLLRALEERLVKLEGGKE